MTHIETLNFARRLLKIFRAGCDFFTEIFWRGVRFFLLKFCCVGAIFLLKFFRAECDTQAIIFFGGRVRICSHPVLAQHPVHSPFFENYSSVSPFFEKNSSLLVNIALIRAASVSSIFMYCICLFLFCNCPAGENLEDNIPGCTCI